MWVRGGVYTGEVENTLNWLKGLFILECLQPHPHLSTHIKVQWKRFNETILPRESMVGPCPSWVVGGPVQLRALELKIALSFLDILSLSVRDR